MTNLYRWILSRIAKKLVIQGPQHQEHITEYYEIMHYAARKEFYEDNRPTLDDFLQECHSDAASNDYGKIRYRSYEVT